MPGLQYLVFVEKVFLWNLPQSSMLQSLATFSPLLLDYKLFGAHIGMASVLRDGYEFVALQLVEGRHNLTLSVFCRSATYWAID